jgi:hypothetical protein
MKPYTVFFEIFEHKFKHTLYAYSNEHAEELIKAKIYFHRVTEGVSKEEDEAFGRIKDVFKKSGINL